MPTNTPQEFEPLLVDPRTKQTAKLTSLQFERYCQLIDGSPYGWFSISDQEPLLQYVRLLSRIDRAQSEVDKLKSEIVHTSHGPQTHPAVRLLDLLTRRASAMREELRINPASRGKALRLTSLGRARAQKIAGAQAIAAATDVAPSRDGLMFGGARVAAMLAAKADDNGIGDDRQE